MEQEELIKWLKRLLTLLSWTTAGCVLLLGMLIYGYHNGPFDPFSSWASTVSDSNPSELETPVAIESRAEALSLFAEGEGRALVVANCTGCHSARLVTQNRATKEGWISMIRWMQETQNLWDLGPNEAPIVEYLAKYYAPEQVGRRAPLSEIEWYELN